MGAIGYLCGYLDADNLVVGMTNNVTLQETFDLVVNAFLTFDDDGNGYISQKEVLDIFRKDGSSKMTPAKRASRNCISEARWRDMDWDKDGTISFSEFLLAFSSWVGMDDDVEQDDGD